jgi:succinate dehydrogenase / fumarate reductase membrane anchor subunit
MIKHYGSKSSGSQAWYLQRWSGLILFLMVLFHFGAMHFVEFDHMAYTEHGIRYATFESVAWRFANPAWKIFDLTFLVLALYHAVNGMWQIFLDVKMPDGIKTAVHGTLYLIGLVLLVMGAATLIPFQGL